MQILQTYFWGAKFPVDAAILNVELWTNYDPCRFYVCLQDQVQVQDDMNYLKRKEQCSRHCSVSWFEKAIIFISISASHSNLLLVPICVLHICLKSVDYTISICS